MSMRKVSSGHLLYIATLYSVKWLLADSEDRDQTVQMRKLIWAFAVCIWLKTRFSPAQISSEHIVG